MNEQRIIQIGNSVGITLPSGFVKSKGIKPGQKVFVDEDVDSDMIHVAVKSKSAPRITPEFKDWLDKFNKKYKKALTELAKR